MITKKMTYKDQMPVEIDERLIDEVFSISSRSHCKVLGIVPATKPCFYKLWSLVEESKRKGLPFILINPGQHYDDLLGHGMKEFNLTGKVAVNLNIRGDLCQKSAELFTKLKYVSEFLKERHPNVTLIPFVNGDTLAAGIVPLAWLFATKVKSI